MKRIANYLIALAVAAFTFTSCADVPSPFGDIVKPASGDVVVIEPSGTGTEADPYNVAGVLEYISGLGADTPSPKEVYIKGYAVELTDISASYGNATFTMSDNADGTANKFTVYRAAGLGNQKVTDESFIKQGDMVVVCGKVTNYKGNTPETVQGAAYVYSVNGNKGGGTTPATTLGTKDAPLTVAQALETINALADGGETADAYVKGTISQVTSYNSTYKSITYYISDDGKTTNELQVYSGKGLNGAEFAAKEDLSVGDQVVIKGKLKKYVKNGNVTPEINQSSEIVTIVKASGGGNDNNLGTKDAPLTVVKALEIINALADGGETADAYVKGTISQVTSYNSTYKSITYYISDDGKTTNELQVYSGKGLNGAEFAAKEDLSVGDQVVIKGKLKKYVKNGNVTPEINQSSEIVTITKASGGGNTGGGSVSAKATEMGFAAQAVATSYTMSDGTVLTFAKGDGSNDPKYYDGDYAAVRMYAKNMLTITSSKTIAKVVITTTSGSGSTKYNGNDTAFAEGSSKVTIKKNSDTEIEFSGLNAKTVKIVNDQEAASGGTQLRLSAITITYAN